MELLLVTGMSGAGKSSALKSLEDMGYEAIDNVPLSLVPLLVAAPEEDRARKLAVGTDLRTKDFTSDACLALLERFSAQPQLECHLLFLECDDEVLRRRFTETARRHPLAPDRAVTDGIALERRLLAPLRARADFLLDTTEFSAALLRRQLFQMFAPNPLQTLSISVLSFAFRRGLPREADLVFDVRFLRNPFYVPSLKDATGRDEAVKAYIDQDPQCAGFFERLSALLVPLLPHYGAQGKSYLTIAMGCTGGRHRSVHMAEKLAGFLENLEYKVNIRHRDLPA